MEKKILYHVAATQRLKKPIWDRLANFEKYEKDLEEHLKREPQRFSGLTL
jgi:hypothetical protein